MTTFIGSSEYHIYCPGCFSLKDKRQVIRSLIDRVSDELNVAVAEVDNQDHHRKASLAFATVSSSKKQIQKIFDKLEKEISGDPALQIREINSMIH